MTHGLSWIRRWGWYGTQAVTQKGIPEVSQIIRKAQLCVNFPAGGSRVSTVETCRSQPGSLIALNSKTQRRRGRRDRAE